MPNIWEQSAAQTAESIIGTGLGLVLEGHNDRRQIRQQQKLTDMQLAATKNLNQFNYDQQLKMWHETNYGAQRKELEAAGLNPGLLYGMSGGGGTTTGSGGGSVSGGIAPSGGGEVATGVGMALQLGILKAQKENIESSTNKNNVEAAKTAGVDTTKTQTEIESLTAGIENTKAQAAYTQVQQTLAEIQADIQGSEINDMKAIIRYGMQKLYAEMQSADITANVDKQTQMTKIKTAQTQLLSIGIQNALTKAQTDLTTEQINKVKSDIDLNKQQLSNWIQDNEIKWRYLSNDEKRVEIQKMAQSLSSDWQVADRFVDVLENVLDGILRGKKTP